ncbi:hypothetical protein [Nocardia rhizosphaerae]|uniref:Uncharacterized protein n=1 Tax=Nocardia rhizosphaerae TaxID=1691571 RepID=A0ABV8L5V2_9NOCA
MSDDRGFLDKAGGQADSGGVRGADGGARPPRWPQRPPPPEPFRFPSEGRSDERARRQLREAEAEADRSSAMVGTFVCVGIAALIGGAYLFDKGDSPEPVVASCVREERSGQRTVVSDSLCQSSGSGGGSYVGKTTLNWPQYRYYYGGTAPMGGTPSGGTTIKPSDAEIRTKSGAVIQRGGLGGRGGSSS